MGAVLSKLFLEMQWQLMRLMDKWILPLIIPVEFYWQSTVVIRMLVSGEYVLPAQEMPIVLYALPAARYWEWILYLTGELTIIPAIQKEYLLPLLLLIKMQVMFFMKMV